MFHTEQDFTIRIQEIMKPRRQGPVALQLCAAGIYFPP
jgi:hypothetical protein